MKKHLALYLHWPFCKSKCPYCDFNSHVADKIEHQKWLDAYLWQLKYYADLCGEFEIKSIFFGGGTPSLMQPELVAQLITFIKANFKLKKDIEITLEANPTSFEAQKFSDFKNAGINRLSLGVQALNDEDLKFLGREHTAEEAIKVIEKVQGIFNNFSFDLIYARPKQTLENWQKELNWALSFGTKHLSLYQLTIEKGTEFYSKYYKEKSFELPKEDLANNLYKLTDEIAAGYGLYSYEVSNYAAPNFESQHNLAYWRYSNYLGIGPGAHSRIFYNNKMQQIIMEHKPEKWLNKIEQNINPIQKQQDLLPNEIIQEKLMMNLRIFEEIFLEDLFLLGWEQNNLSKLQCLAKEQIITLKENSFVITSKGRLVLNQVINYLC